MKRKIKPADKIFKYTLLLFPATVPKAGEVLFPYK
jgi:hypothetical protein